MIQSYFNTKLMQGGIRIASIGIIVVIDRLV